MTIIIKIHTYKNHNENSHICNSLLLQIMESDKILSILALIEIIENIQWKKYRIRKIIEYLNQKVVADSFRIDHLISNLDWII